MESQKMIPNNEDSEGRLIGGSNTLLVNPGIEASVKNKLRHQERSKKKQDPYAHHPTLDERARSEKGRLVLGNASKEYQHLYIGNNLDLTQFETIIKGSSHGETYLIAIGLILNKDLLNDTLKIFDRWLKENYPNSASRNSIETLLTDGIKDAIFDFFFVEDLYLSKLAYRIFNLAAQGEKYQQKYKTVIENVITKPSHDYKTALALSTVLELRGYFLWNTLVIPAILLSVPKEHYEEFLDGDDVRTKQFVKWLDDLYKDNREKIAQLHAKYVNILPKLDFTRLHSKSLERFIKSSIQRYDLEPDVAPNFIAQKEFSSLKHLILREKEGKPRSVWRGLVELRIEGNISLQNKLIELLEIDDIYEAAFWAQKLQLKELSPSVQVLVQKINQGRDNFPTDDEYLHRNNDEKRQNENSTTSNEAIGQILKANGRTDCEQSNISPTIKNTYCKLPLPHSAIAFIDDIKGLKEFIEYVNGCSEYIYGMDAEFGPSNVLSKEKIAILQIANAKRVYILDMFTLAHIENIEIEFERLIEAFFCNNGIQIVGYGLSNDWSFLSNTHKAFKNIKTRRVSNCVDLFNLVNRVTKGFDRTLFKLPYKKKRDDKGLSGLTVALFNVRLDKTYQQSNWIKRPLLPEQITYAALDALICVNIFMELEVLATKSDQTSTFQECCDHLKRHQNKLPKDIKQQQTTSSENNLDELSAEIRGLQSKRTSLRPEHQLNTEPIKPPDLKVVCENMLQGLCKKLRLQGVDAEVLEPYEYFEVATERAEKEGRMILTKSLDHAAQLKRIFKEEHVLYIIEDKLEEQIKEVFWYFNVQPDEKYVFSRCSNCNCGCFITLDQDVMLKLNQAITSIGNIHNEIEDTIIVRSQTEKDGILKPPIDKPVDKQYFKCDGGDISIQTGRVKMGGTKLRIKDVHINVIYAHDKFYGCIKCGKIFWEGSHWNRYLDKSSDL